MNKQSISTIKYKTVKDHLSNVETTYLEGEYFSSDSEDEEQSDEESFLDFEQEYVQMEKRSREMGFRVDEEDVDKAKFHKSEPHVRDLFFFIVFYVFEAFLWNLMEVVNRFKLVESQVMPHLTQSKFKLDQYETPKRQGDPQDNLKEFKRLTSINKTSKFSLSNFAKSKKPASQEIPKEEPPKEDSKPPEFNKTNRYFLNLSENQIEDLKIKLKPVYYGPCIMAARDRKEYYQIMSFRKHRIFKLKTIRDIESQYTKEDRYFESVMEFKKRLEKMTEKNIRDFLKMFYMEE